MRRINKVLLSLLGSILIHHTAALAQTGLIFASDAQLAGVPLASTPFSGGELPSSADLSESLPPPGNQGNQQSCVAWSLAYALKSYQEYVEEHVPLTGNTGEVNRSRVFSPAYIYNQINQSRDGGALIIDGLNLLSSRGAATLSAMPYVESDYKSQPSASIHSSASRYKIDYWRRVNIQDIKEIKAQLNAGYPVVIGAAVDEGFLHQTPGKVWSAPQGRVLGGHAMTVVGYDDRLSAFKVINSWGRNWADAGYGWIAYHYFPQVVREGYVAKDAKNGPASPSPAPAPAPPNPGPSTRPNVNLSLLSVQHNVPGPAGLGMRIDGNMTLPPGSSGVGQVVVQIYVNAGGQKGQPVNAMIPAFSTVHGTAASGTPAFNIPMNGLSTNWYVYVPYDALAIPRGVKFTPSGPIGMPITSYLMAEPALFIDQFGVKTLGAIPFTVGL